MLPLLICLLAVAAVLPAPGRSRPALEAACAAMLFASLTGLLIGLALGAYTMAEISVLTLTFSFALALWLARAIKPPEEGEDKGPWVDWDEFDRLREEWRRWGPRKPQGSPGAAREKTTA